MTVYIYCILHKAGRILICCVEGRYTGFLHLWQDLFIITHDRIHVVYCIKQEGYWICCWKVRIRDSDSRGRISSSLHMTVFIMYTA